MWKQQFRRGKNVGREMKLFADKGVYSGRHIIFVRYLPEDAIEFPVFFGRLSFIQKLKFRRKKIMEVLWIAMQISNTKSPLLIHFKELFAVFDIVNRA
jgi:hypothetical protein